MRGGVFGPQDVAELKAEAAGEASSEGNGALGGVGAVDALEAAAGTALDEAEGFLEPPHCGDLT